MKRLALVFASIFYTINAFALTPGDNLGTWRSSSSADKTQLAQTMASRLNKAGVTATFLYTCINDTAADGGVDFMKISEVAAACSVL